MTKEIGSEFEMPDPDLLMADGVPLPSDAALVGTGRHALSLVAMDLLDRGVTTIAVPDHYCESMTVPFTTLGMQIILCDTTDQMVLNGHSVQHILAARNDHVAILHSETFGTPANDDLRSALDAATSAGTPIILDKTHSLLSQTGAEPRADYEIASLRKLLPIPDGGYVRGLRRAPVLQMTPEHRSFVQFRRRAAAQKSSYLEQKSLHKLHLDQFRHAEHLLDSDLTPSRISDLSRTLLTTLDYHSIRRARIENASALEAALTSIGVKVANSSGWRNSPAYLVIRHPEVSLLRGYLSSKKIYCPIHWPRPAGTPGPRSWRTDLLSLPIDHRYTTDDMRRVASTILEYQEMHPR